jgi:hypothetical protein
MLPNVTKVDATSSSLRPFKGRTRCFLDDEEFREARFKERFEDPASLMVDEGIVKKS